MKRSLIQTPAFVRAAKRLFRRQPDVAQALRQTLAQLEADAFDPCLRAHKLQGALAGCWSASAGYDLRIVFQLVERNDGSAVLLLSVGTHDEVN